MADAEILVKIVDQTKGSLSNIQKNINNFDKGVTQTNRNLSSMNTSILQIGAAIASSFAVKEIIGITARFEDLRTTLASVAGSAEGGAEAFQFISDFATKTQFGIEELTNTYIKLRTSGIEPTEELLTTFTDTAAVTTDQLGTLTAITDLFSRTTSGGLGLEELNRLADRGVPVFKMLEETIGLTRLEVSEFGKTADGAKIITDALILSLNKDFGGATQDRLGNLSTQLSNLGIAATNAADLFGQQFAGSLGDVVTSITEFITENDALIISLGQGLATAIGFVADNFATMTAAGGTLIALGLTKWVYGLATAMKALALSNPFTAIALVAVTAAAAIYDNWEPIKSWFTSFFTSMRIKFNEFKLYVLEALDVLPFVDFQDEIAETEAYIGDLTTKLQEQATTQGDVVKSIEDTNTVQGENNTLTQAGTEAAGTYEEQLAELRDRANEVGDAQGSVNNEYTKFIGNLERSVELAQFDSKERQRQQTIYRALEARAKALGKTVATLADTEVQAVTSTIEALLDKQAAYETERELLEERTEFIADTEEEIRDIARETMNQVQLLEQEKQDFIKEAQEKGLEDHKTVQDRILEYDTQIKDEQKNLEAELAKQRQDLINDTKSEYSNLYGFMGDKLEEFTGVSKKEFGLINDVTKLVFGTDIQGIFDQTFTQGILGAQNMRKGTDSEMKLLSSGVASEMGNSENSVFGFANNTLTVMSGWVKSVFNNFSTLGGGIIEILGTAFQWLTGGFSSVFGSLSGFIGGFFGSIGDLIGGIIDIPFMAEGGYLPSGQTAIVGEAGPELISGPARVTSTDDTADILSGMGGGVETSMNVTFNINTVDARGFDELLTSRRDVITDLVRTAVTESPSRQLRGVY